MPKKGFDASVQSPTVTLAPSQSKDTRQSSFDPVVVHLKKVFELFRYSVKANEREDNPYALLLPAKTPAENVAGRIVRLAKEFQCECKTSSLDRVKESTSDSNSSNNGSDVSTDSSSDSDTDTSCFVCRIMPTESSENVMDVSSEVSSQSISIGDVVPEKTTAPKRPPLLLAKEFTVPSSSSWSSRPARNSRSSLLGEHAARDAKAAMERAVQFLASRFELTVCGNQLSNCPGPASCSLLHFPLDVSSPPVTDTTPEPPAMSSAPPAATPTPAGQAEAAAGVSPLTSAFAAAAQAQREGIDILGSSNVPRSSVEQALRDVAGITINQLVNISRQKRA
jgi:hypothetical protein